MFNVSCHLQRELGTLCNVPANWARSVSDFFLSESIPILINGIFIFF